MMKRLFVALLLGLIMWAGYQSISTAHIAYALAETGGGGDPSPSPSGAASVGTKVCSISPNSPGCGSTALIGGPNSVFGKVIGVVIFVVGAISVLMIVIGGLRYVLSGGDPAGIRSAKDTILYAIVGLVLAALAYGIVAFVIGHL